MEIQEIAALVEKQRTFFNTRVTYDVSFRVNQLRALKKAILDHEEAIYEALRLDLKKSRFETYVSEIALLLKEIDHSCAKLPSWAKPKRTWTPLVHFPALSSIYSEPLGVTLIIGTWNYPIQLTLGPLIAAMSAGNCAIVVPSRLAPNTSRLMGEMIGKNFDPGLVTVVEGGGATAQALLEHRFDHIFFTGGTNVGKQIAMAAAKHLTPCTLELGGKSPCIVDRNVRLDVTARRITWGKFFNAGQSCVAPDYLLVDKAIKKDLLETIKDCITKFYGENPQASPDYSRIVNSKHFERLSGLMSEGDIIIGGKTDPGDKYIAPTVIDNVSMDHKVMESEIFGPILPVVEYETLSQAIEMVNSRPKPLSLYLFSDNSETKERVLRETSSGGGCVNDTVVHLSTRSLPFGGVGDSGMGRYHGKAGFDTFSNQKSILKRPFWLDVNLRYAPYGTRLPFMKKLLGLFG
ncbi:MAG: aldehyde dehydrogenase [Desulfomonile tiedjei]|nr:aldehyde dehydrogenase [Desulfomonile tiedjei]